MQKLKIIFFTAICLVFVACTHEKRHVDTSAVDLEVQIERFDSAVWTLSRTNLDSSLNELNAKYPDITPIYFENVVEFGHVGDSLTTYTLQRFFADSSVNHLYTETLKHFADMSVCNSQLTEAFKRAQVLFPTLKTPNVYAHVSGLNQSVVVGDGFVSASLDCYLGTDYELYTNTGIYSYLRANMRPEKLVPDLLVCWLSSEFEFVPQKGELLEELVYRGKLLYALSVLLPDAPEELLMGYTPEQWQWCKRFEGDMWMTLIGSKDLFGRDFMKRTKYLGDAPFTQPFSQESPGRAGAYVGWQIVESYMRNNPQISVEELMRNPYADAILRESQYDPKNQK